MIERRALNPEVEGLNPSPPEHRRNSVDERELNRHEIEHLKVFEQILKDPGISEETRTAVEDTIKIITNSRQRRKTKNKQEQS